MSKRGSNIRSLQVALGAIFTALTTAATMGFSIYVPATKGYFNIGEVIVYTTAILLGPFIGAIAGGVGSMLADIILGYSIYAPGTLVIKGLEGFIVGFLASKLKANVKVMRLLGILSAGLVASTLWLVGSTVYSGVVEAYIGSSLVATGEVSTLFWLILAGLTFTAIAVASFRAEPNLSMLIAAILIGGSEMVLGYYLYESLILGYYALAEVPVNIGQMTIGLIASLPLVRTLSRVSVFRVLKIKQKTP
ncbi:ECF transporter S component [Candidatus Bathyarchaeota archaeon]|nr:ECF transporter S component [Candidatus Bathyarchaeota archaeon]